MANYFEYVTSNKGDFFNCLGEELDRDKEFKELQEEFYDLLENSGNKQLLLDVESVHVAIVNKGAIVGFNLGFAHVIKILAACHNDISLVKYFDGRKPVLHFTGNNGEEKAVTI